MRVRAASAGLALLAVEATLCVWAVDAVSRTHGVMPHVRDIRAWSLAAPVALALALARRRTPAVRHV